MNYGDDQYSCLVKLWDRESNWRHTARNQSSGAYGIPQALPGTKMATEGPDYMTNPETQIRWGVKYIKGRYGSPCGAVAHSDKLGWY
jgi:soluble lytic murein transglycosylase-like protein